MFQRQKAHRLMSRFGPIYSHIRKNIGYRTTMAAGPMRDSAPVMESSEASSAEPAHVSHAIT